MKCLTPRSVLAKSLGLLGAASLLTAVGCETCTEKAEGMMDNYNRSYQLQWKCCMQMTNPARTECFNSLRADAAEIGALIVQWQSACETGREELMNSIARQIVDRVTACLPGAIIGQVTGATNFDSPLADVPMVSLDIRPATLETDAQTAFGAGQSTGLEDTTRSGAPTSLLRGEICIGIGDAVICGRAKGRLAYIASDTDHSNQGSYRPTRFSLSLDVAGIPVLLALAPHSENRMTFDRDGTGILQAAMSMSVPGDSGLLQQEVWLEFPVVRTLGGVAIKSAGISGLDLAPEAPPAFADWNDDGSVDDLDYAEFTMDFADQATDLNLDGQVNDLDFRIFAQTWESAL